MMRKRNWAELPQDLIGVIADWIDSFEDYFAFRGVCRSWRSAATKETFNRLSPQIPLLMIPVPGSDCQEFYSLSRSKKFAAPSLVRLPATCKLCLESRGWLITIGENEEMSLLHPFSGAQFQLPNYPWPLNLEEPKAKILLSDNVQDFEIVIFYRKTHHQLMFWRHGYKAWTNLSFDFSRCRLILDFPKHNVLFHDFAYSHMDNKFYAVNCRGIVVALERDMQNNVVYPQLVVGLLDCISSAVSSWGYYSRFYIVDLSETSLIVVGHWGAISYYYCEHYHVFEMDLSSKTVKHISNLGDKAIFLCPSSDSTIVQVSSFPGKIEANNVYFIRDKHEYFVRNKLETSGDLQVYVYSMEDRIVKPYYCCGSYPPIFATPSFY